MIQPNAKCVVNGKKVNEIALWLNQFIALKNEELDVVDANNTPAKRWFLTGGIPGGVGSAESGDRDNLGGTSGGAAGTGGGASGNRDQLNPAPAGGNAGGPVGGGGGQGGNVNPPVNIGGGGGGGAAGGGGGRAAGGAGRVRTPAGSATAIGGRRAQPSNTGIAPETLPAADPTPAPEPVAPEATAEPTPEPLPEPTPEPTPEPAPEPAPRAPYRRTTAGGKPIVDVSKLSPEQKAQLEAARKIHQANQAKKRKEHELQWLQSELRGIDNMLYGNGPNMPLHRFKEWSDKRRELKEKIRELQK